MSTDKGPSRTEKCKRCSLQLDGTQLLVDLCNRCLELVGFGIQEQEADDGNDKRKDV